MKRELEMWSLVVVGKWNPAILSPQWISEKVLEEEQIQIMFPVVGDAPPRYEAADIRISVSRDRVQFWALRDEDALLEKIETAAAYILDTLEHTPISALGENFHYTFPFEAPPSKVAALFDLPDMEELQTDVGLAKEVSVVRTLALQSCALNFKLVKQQQICRAELNYHYDVDSAKAAAERVKGTFVTNRNHGQTFLRKIYGLELEENEEDVEDDE